MYAENMQNETACMTFAEYAAFNKSSNRFSVWVSAEYTE